MFFFFLQFLASPVSFSYYSTPFTMAKWRFENSGSWNWNGRIGSVPHSTSSCTTWSRGIWLSTELIPSICTHSSTFRCSSDLLVTTNYSLLALNREFLSWLFLFSLQASELFSPFSPMSWMFFSITGKRSQAFVQSTPSQYLPSASRWAYSQFSHIKWDILYL